jgi:hypothetical protein
VAAPCDDRAIIAMRTDDHAVSAMQ